MQVLFSNHFKEVLNLLAVREGSTGIWTRILRGNLQTEPKFSPRVLLDHLIMITNIKLGLHVFNHTANGFVSSKNYFATEF